MDDVNLRRHQDFENLNKIPAIEAKIEYIATEIGEVKHGIARLETLRERISILEKADEGTEQNLEDLKETTYNEMVTIKKNQIDLDTCRRGDIDKIKDYLHAIPTKLLLIIIGMGCNFLASLAVGILLWTFFKKGG